MLRLEDCHLTVIGVALLLGLLSSLLLALPLSLLLSRSEHVLFRYTRIVQLVQLKAQQLPIISIH